MNFGFVLGAFLMLFVCVFCFKISKSLSCNEYEKYIQNNSTPEYLIKRINLVTFFYGFVGGAFVPLLFIIIPWLLNQR